LVVAVKGRDQFRQASRAESQEIEPPAEFLTPYSSRVLRKVVATIV
jgi:hypothetical protein